MALEHTLVLIKPDGVRRRLVGEIITRFERKGLRLAALRMLHFDESLVHNHYAEHKGKPFFESLKQFIMSGAVIAMVLEGEKAVSVVRGVMGATNFLEAAPGTIRGDHAISTQENLVHGSDSVQSASREIPLFFTPDQVFH